MTSPDDPGEPLDLGVVGPGAEPDPPGGSGDDRRARSQAGWRKWGTLAAAAVVGVAGGLVIAEARDDAAGYSSVELFGGSLQPINLGTRPQGELTVTLLNSGEHSVDIIGVEVDGVTVADGAEPAEPVAAEPGSWVTFVQRGLEVDCSGPLPTSMRVRARTESGDERLVEVQPPDNHDNLRGFWYSECQIPFGLRVGNTGLIEAGDDAVVLALELVNDGFDDLVLGSVGSRAPGFDLGSDAADLAVPSGQSVTVVTTWTVRDCSAALRATGGSLAISTVTSGDEAEQLIQIPDSAFTPLARLSGQVCPATIQE